MAITSITTPPEYHAVRSQAFLEITSDASSNAGFQIEIELRDSSSSTLFGPPAVTFKYKVNTDGELKIDIKDLLLQYMEPRGLLSLPYIIAYRERWDGFTGTYTESSILYAQYIKTNFAQSNDLADFVADPTAPGEILNDYPVAYRDFKKQLSFIPGSALDGLQARATVTQLDINQSVLVGPTIQTIDTSALSQGEIVSFAPNMVTIDNQCYYIQIQVFDITGVTPYTDAKVFKVENVCNPVLAFEYLSKLGCFETVVFQYEQTVQDVTTIGSNASNPITTQMADATRTKTRFNIDQYQFVRCQREGINFTEYLNLLELKESPDLSLMVNTFGGGSLGVRVSNEFNSEYRMSETNFDFMVEFELPNNFRLGEGIDYTPVATGAFLKTAFSTGFN